MGARSAQTEQLLFATFVLKLPGPRNGATRLLHSVDDGGDVSLGNDVRQLPPMTGAHHFDQWA
jgi:hypothetical protein